MLGKETENNDVSWEGKPSSELLRLAWPITVTTLSYSTMTLVDTLFVGQLGPAALAGVGLGSTAAFAAVCFSFGMMRGAKVLVSQARGAGEHDAIGRYLGAGIMLAFAAGLVSSVAALMLGPAVASLGATAEAGDAARIYFVIRVLPSPILFIQMAVRETRYGLGDSQSPMRAALAGNGLNIVLDYVLIFACGMGVAGAAWATVLGQGLEMLLLLRTQWRDGFNVRGTRRADVAALWRVGSPTGVQFLLEVGSFSILAGLLSRLSELDMAAHMIALQIVHFSFLPAFAVGEAASVMVGQAVGARREALVRPVARLALLWAAAYGAVCAVVMVVGNRWFAEAFTNDATLVQRASALLWVAAAFQVFDAANVVARTVLRGTGDVRVPAAICIVLSWVSLPPLTYLLGYGAGLGAVGGWIAICIEVMAGAGILWWRLEREGWRPAAALAREQREASADTAALVPAT